MHFIWLDSCEFDLEFVCAFDFEYSYVSDCSVFMWLMHKMIIRYTQIKHPNVSNSLSLFCGMFLFIIMLKCYLQYMYENQSQDCVSIASIVALWCDVFVIEINVSGWKGDRSINVKSIANVTVIFSHLQASIERIGDLSLCKWVCHCRIHCAGRDYKQAKLNENALFNLLLPFLLFPIIF